MVRLNDGSKMHMSLPPDTQMPMESNLEHRVVLEELEEEMVDQEEEEMLGASLYEEELEEVVGDAAQKDSDPPKWNNARTIAY
jgi:hypothetical protein